MRHNRLRSAGKTANGCLTAQRRGISLPMLECKHAIPCGNGTVLAIPLPSGTRSRISLQAYIGFAGTGGFSPKGTKALLGMRQGSQICPAALVVQHKIQTSAGRISRQAKAKEQQLLRAAPFPPLQNSQPHFPQACIGLAGMGGFAPKATKALLGMRQGSQICPAALIVQHRFRRSKKALPTAFRGRLRSGNCFGYPSTFRDSKPHFPASLYLFGRHGRLCPEGAKILLRGCAQIAPALRRGSCAASSVNLKKDSACPVLAFERAIPILHRRRPRRIAVCVHRKSGWNPERKRPLPFRATAQRNGLFSMFLFACSAFLFDAVSGHSSSGKSEGTVSPGTKAHAAQVKGSHANPCKPAWAEKP